MTTIFRYSKVLHVRRPDPGPRTDYRAYKDDLRREFERRCVYCSIPDTLNPAGKAGFHIDHYRPKKLFPQLSTSYANLFYSCSQCNMAKGAYWPKDGEKDEKFIPNPCDHRMFDHLRYKDGTVVGHSLAGKFSIEQLDLNDPRSVQFREDANLALKLAVQRLGEFVRAREEINAKAKAGKKVPEALREKVDREISAIRRVIDRHMGIDPQGRSTSEELESLQP